MNPRVALYCIGVRSIAVAVILISSIGLIGHIANVYVLLSWSDKLPPMALPTAIALFLLGLAVYVLALRKQNGH